MLWERSPSGIQGVISVIGYHKTKCCWFHSWFDATLNIEIVSESKSKSDGECGEVCVCVCERERKRVIERYHHNL